MIALAGLGWNASHQRAFQDMVNAIRDATTLAFPNPDLVLCLFTDASHQFWSIVITQIPEEDLTLPFCEQRHRPLAFCSGEYNGAALRWSIPEKEAYPIYRAVLTFDYLLCSDKHAFHIFTDHKNLIFLFNPTCLDTRLKRHSLDKIHRWRLVLEDKHYLIESISSADNVWADLTYYEMGSSTIDQSRPCIEKS